MADPTHEGALFDRLCLEILALTFLFRETGWRFDQEAVLDRAEPGDRERAMEALYVSMTWLLQNGLIQPPLLNRITLKGRNAEKSFNGETFTIPAPVYAALTRQYGKGTRIIDAMQTLDRDTPDGDRDPDDYRRMADILGEICTISGSSGVQSMD